MPMPPAITIEVPYAPPERHGKRIHGEGVRWHIDVDDPLMSERAELIARLDPALPSEEVVGVVYDTWGNFLCRHCGSPLVFNGQNGAGTTALRCKPCGRNMSIWNTFELSIWKFKKAHDAMLHYMYGGSVKSSSSLHGIGKGFLDEMRMCLPDIRYSRDGPLEVVEYDGKEFGVVTIDMMYKGQRGVMLGVCGGLNTTTLGNENTGEGLKEFLDEVEERVGTENYMFVMDMRLNVAKMILERFGERAVVVLQNHTTWGDVLVYFHREEWYTLRLRTDAFSEASQKRDEEALLGVGEIELYEGLKGVSPGGSLRDVTGHRLRKKVEELLIQVGNADWEERGRVDLVMRPKLMKLNGLLRELKRRGEDIGVHVDTLRGMMRELEGRYTSTIKRSVKRKVLNAWRALTLMSDDVERLWEALLKEPLPSRGEGSGHGEAREEMKRGGWARFLGKPRLLYRGRMGGPSVPEQAHWALGLLREVFYGKEITTNPCEGRFGVIGTAFRQGRSMYIERAVTRVHLQRQGPEETAGWLVENYPIQDMGMRGPRGSRTHIKVGGRYAMTYVDRLGTQTERVIDVEKRKRKVIIAYCHLREDERTFKRTRIKRIIPIPLAS